MYKLWIANKNYSSWSLRPWVLLKVLQIPFEENLCFFENGKSSHNKFSRFSPTGLVPCLVDDKLTVWDSLAICEYIAETHPLKYGQKITKQELGLAALVQKCILGLLIYANNAQ